MKMKKSVKIVLIVIVLLILVGCGVVGYYFFFKKEPAPETPIKEIEITNTIDQFGYTLEDRDTDLFVEKFNELKELLNQEEYDVKEYISLISQLFVIDLFTIDNKMSRYDVGGLEYVYSGAVSSFQTVAENSIYKTVENNLDDSRTQQLPEVSSVTISVLDETTFTMPDESVVNGYRVKLSWTYQENLGYDTNGSIILIPDGEKYGVVYFDSN